MASHEAARRAVANGYTDVSVMADGIVGWFALHQPIQHADVHPCLRQERRLDHQFPCSPAEEQPQGNRKRIPRLGALGGEQKSGE